MDYTDPLLLQIGERFDPSFLPSGGMTYQAPGGITIYVLWNKTMVVVDENGYIVDIDY